MIQAQPTVELSLDRMQMADIEEVCRIERRSFSNPWPMSAYRRELRKPEQNSYYVLRVKPLAHDELGEARGSRNRFLDSLIPIRRSDPNFDADHLAGYVGMWRLYGETHITTIAVEKYSQCPARVPGGLGRTVRRAGAVGPGTAG